MPNLGVLSRAMKSIIVQLEFEPSIAITASRFDKLHKNIRSFRDPLKDCIRKVMAPSIQRNFDVGGRPPWQPLAPDTPMLRVKLHKAPPGPKMRQKGTLRRVMGQQNIWTVTTTSAAILKMPARVSYGVIHQTGYSGRKGTARPIPARPFIMIHNDDADDMEKIFEDWLEKKINQAGLGRGVR